MFNNLITPEQFFISAVLALILTIVYRMLVNYKKRNYLDSQYKVDEIKAILNRCYTLFPREDLNLNGSLFKRGMEIRIVTNQNKTFEGKFIGTNDDEMLCIMTKKFIIAYAIENIGFIEKIEQ